MKNRVLLVDDDPNVLKAYQRRLRRRFEVETALCSEEGVTAVNILGPFAVVVSDMTMPREDGAHFLAKILEAAPDSVRIMLTGNADQQSAADAVNRGRVFRFLNKPCPAEELEAAIEAAIEEHERLVRERELVGRTVHGCVAMLTRILALADPAAFGRSERLGRLAGRLAEASGFGEPWEVETAGLLSQVGVFAAPPGVRARVVAGEELSEGEAAAWSEQYRVAADLIAEAPRLERVAAVVALQADGAPAGDVAPSTREAGELLRAALEFDRLTTDREIPSTEAIEAMAESPSVAVEAIEALRAVVEQDEETRIVDIEPDQLVEGMRLLVDLATTGGTVLVARGQEVSGVLVARIRAYTETHDVRSPIRVSAPVGFAAAAE